MKPNSVYPKKARTFVKKLQGQLVRQALRLTGRLHPELAAQKAEGLFLTPRRMPANRHQQQVLDRGSQGLVQVGGDIVRVWRWGHGPGVLLVHGWSGRGSQFADWVDQLVEAGFQVTLFDAPGHGDSGGQSSSLAQFVATIREIARHYGPFETLIGHSMGGAAGLAAVAGGLPLQQLVTLAAPGDLAAVMRRTFQGLMGLAPELNPLIERRLEARFGIPMHSLDPKALAPEVELPWLLLHDLDDREIPWSEAEELSRATSAAQLLSTKGLGHYRILRDPGVRQHVRAFLLGLDPQPLASPEMGLLLGS